MNKSHLAKLSLCAVLFLFGWHPNVGCSPLTQNSTIEKAISQSFSKVFLEKADHTAFDALLKKYVSEDGHVDYDGFKTEKLRLESYLDHLNMNPPDDSYSKEESLAYWINLYNASTIYLIVKRYPIRSIIEINQREPWSFRFVKSGNEVYTLNQIEHQIIRPKFQDARIHFALNCAARSCPRLLNGAYFGETLNDQLEKITADFMNDAERNTISPSIVQLSKLFEWYHDDFGNLHEFINKYSVVKIANDANIAFKAYDWSLNM